MIRGGVLGEKISPWFLFKEKKVGVLKMIGSLIESI